jgi:hypothetical protein
MIRLSLISTSLLLALQFSTANSAQSKPNILVIIDNGCQVIRCRGSQA